MAVLALKNDLEGPDDVSLAVREVQALARVAPREVDSAEAIRILGIPEAPASWAGRKLYACECPSALVDTLRRRLAFWDTIWQESWATPSAGVTPAEHEDLLSTPTVSAILEATARLKRADCPADLDAWLAEWQAAHRPSAPSAGSRPSPALRRKNGYLTHPFHKYKAKFFPRLARALTNTVCPDAGMTVVDPFSGSGTAPIEASLMGLHAVGLDIDPLAVFVGHAKSEMEDVDVAALVRARDTLSHAATAGGQLTLFGSMHQAVPGNSFHVPAFLLARRPARFPPDEVTRFEAETNALLALTRHEFEGPVRDWLLLALSHALATKISLRWMGTGDNRFALEVAKRSVTSVFLTQLDLMIDRAQWYKSLRTVGVLDRPVEPRFHVHDATLPSLLKPGSVDGIVTSPPYLPASSGRETYLRSHAISLVALGLLTEGELAERESKMLGSILALPAAESAVPASVESLALWMSDQRARGAKARPTIAYFQKLSASLLEMKRILRRGGRAAIVVSRSHRFYELASRQVVREFDMAAAIAEVAAAPAYGVGFSVDEIVDVELPKMDFVARPGSSGSYHESVVFLRRK